MATQTLPKTAFDNWRDGIDKAAGDARWDAWDSEIQTAVNECNQHLSSVSAGYRPLDWQVIKAMLWVESGPHQPDWNSKPMQIGEPGDPGLASLLSGKEGGNLILPPEWKGCLTVRSALTIPAYNIRAGIAYLLMRMANYEYRSVPDTDTKVYEATVKPGDSLDRIAQTHGSTLEVMKKLNPATAILRPGQVLRYQKASLQRVITSWRPLSAAMIADRYNGGGDPGYAKKLDYALSAVRKEKAAGRA
ncbi:MAG: LysM peptidoglycan-binding domain-containing protein [Burkholderiaceae bacterium]|jgi:hypothetical protein|nr:LysM peptidoglycan-binding domain-containing protein [Burkholderiaceae bacterium]